jgi:hypothetical protein
MQILHRALEPCRMPMPFGIDHPTWKISLGSTVELCCRFPGALGSQPLHAFRLREILDLLLLPICPVSEIDADSLE